MATEQCFQETEIESDGSSLAKWVDDGSPFGDFECNICLDLVKDPVVTFCGHLYCWPCIYGWITLEDPDQQQAQCPVCQSEVSDKTLIPLYGRGQTTNPSEDKVSDLGKPIPKRPLCPRFGVDVGKTTTIFDRAFFFLCWCVILLLLLF